jgi:hypothetical protein
MSPGQQGLNQGQRWTPAKLSEEATALKFSDIVIFFNLTNSRSLVNADLGTDKES